MKEIWKYIKNYEALYQVSNLGRVKSSSSNNLLKPLKHNKGYLRVRLYKNGKSKNHRIHRLVAQAFIPNPENKPQVNHIDEDKTNNRVDSIEWVTNRENNNHGTHNERVSKTLSIPIIATNLKTGESKEFYGSNECARQLGLHYQHISKVLNGKRKQTGGYTFKYKGGY